MVRTGWLCIRGIIGYVLLSTGSVLDLWGSPISVRLIIPGGLFELVFAFRMVFKGLDHG
jgi:hypothetical protein